MRPEERRDFRFAHRAVGSADREIDQLIFGGGNRVTVQLEEHEGRAEGYALVAINERVVLDDVEQVGGRLLVEGGVELHVLEAGAWHSQRGLQHADLTDAVGAAIPLDHVGVERQDLVEEEEASHSASRLNAPA